jgi:opacity protein-like surface antigen
MRSVTRILAATAVAAAMILTTAGIASATPAQPDRLAADICLLGCYDFYHHAVVDADGNVTYVYGAHHYDYHHSGLVIVG